MCMCMCVGLLSVFGHVAWKFYAVTGHVVGVTAAGVVAGTLFVLSGLFSFLAIPELGLAIAQGVWGGSAVSAYCDCRRNLPTIKGNHMSSVKITQCQRLPLSYESAFLFLVSLANRVWLPD
jgi:hypothetical protein